MRLRHLFRTYSFRTTLRYVGLFGIAIAMLFAVIYFVTAHTIKAELREQVEEEEALLLDLYRSDGPGALGGAITQRLSSPAHLLSFYLLQDSDGSKVVGNLPAMAPFGEWRELPIPFEEGGEDDTDLLLAHGEMLPDGRFLVIGQDMDQFNDMEEWIIQVAGWSLLAAFLLALVGGLATSQRILRRIEAVTGVTSEIVQGNLSHRIPLRGTGDEFDQLSANLNQMLDRIQMLMEGLRQMSNDIAHDLRSPLTRLRQHLENAQSKGAEEHGDVIRKAIKETDDILHTFTALMRIAQIEAGTRRSAFTDVDLSSVIAAIVEAYAAVAEDERHIMHSSIAPGVMVRGDRQLLTQMVANLVENALRHTPDGTVIELGLEGGGGAAPICTIADNGPGIPQSERAKVFHRFYRLDRSRSTPGSGLGLSLVAAIAELHRIIVEIDDKQPGLRIVLRFPAA